ncbi:MAG: hypothetical protein KJ814_05425, partial [Proteobacteria bacterium]|nr:hypothetical protein [Pseudomonadota bacterium]
MNRLVNIFSQALRAVIALKLRSFFCILSIAIGISAITVIVAATEGAYQKAFDIVATFGPDSVLIVGGSEETRGIVWTVAFGVVVVGVLVLRAWWGCVGFAARICQGEEGT